MMILLCDDLGNAAIIHYASWKCKRVTISILAAGVYALIACFDYCFTLAHDFASILSQTVPIEILTDSKSIFDRITKLASVSEKRLLIELSALRQACVSGQIRNLGHVPSQYNIADPLTKKIKSDLYISILKTGKLSHPVNQSIIHTETSENNSDVFENG